jgi:hypothetical protein
MLPNGDGLSGIWLNCSCPRFAPSNRHLIKTPDPTSARPPQFAVFLIQELGHDGLPFALNLTWSGYSADQLAAAKASVYKIRAIRGRIDPAIRMIGKAHRGIQRFRDGSTV